MHSRCTRNWKSDRRHKEVSFTLEETCKQDGKVLELAYSEGRKTWKHPEMDNETGFETSEHGHVLVSPRPSSGRRKIR
jgi:hypothetical protein